jgi:hypothetical protein
MTIKYNVSGKQRKALANTIATWLGEEVKYLGAPSFAYEIDFFTIDKDGNLIFDDMADSEMIENLIEHLHDEGFELDMSADTKDEYDGISISVPLMSVTLTNLNNIIEAKGSLIKKAIGATDLPVKVEDDKVTFPWFAKTDSQVEIKAYEQFICSLCAMSKNLKRANSKEKEVENEKYAFRCFLLRLGFIGTEYKTYRKILLRNLEGSSAFKEGKKNVVAE